MGSSFMPLATYGNPTGADIGFGLNPNFAKETMKGLQSFSIPSGGLVPSDSNVVPLGTAGQSPFMAVQTNPTAPKYDVNGEPVGWPGNIPWPPPWWPNPPGTPTTGGTSPQGGNPNTWFGQDPITGLPLTSPQGAPSPFSVPGGGTSFGYPVPQTNQNLAGLTPGGPGAGVTLSGDLKKRLDKTYGKGFSALLQQMISLKGGFNPQVANAFVNAIEPYFQRHMNDLMELFGASGQRFASTAALAGGQFAADFTAQQQQLFAQLYMWSFTNYINTLGAALNAAKIDSTNNIWGTLGNIAGLANAGLTALQTAGVIGSSGGGFSGGGGGTSGSVQPTPPFV